MSRFTLTAQEIQNAINALQSSNGEFKSRVGELQSLQTELSGQWQGDANTAFTAAFNADKGQWDTFAQLMDQYIEALAQIKQSYEAAEATNVSTAATRTYG